jgi:hypothetical protein
MELLLVLEWLLPTAQYPRNFPALPCIPAGRPLCPIPRGRICTTPLFSNSISINFLNVSRPHVRQFINTEYRKGILSLRRNTRSLTTLYECLFTLMQRSA